MKKISSWLTAPPINSCAKDKITKLRANIIILQVIFWVLCDTITEKYKYAVNKKIPNMHA